MNVTADSLNKRVSALATSRDTKLFKNELNDYAAQYKKLLGEDGYNKLLGTVNDIDYNNRLNEFYSDSQKYLKGLSSAAGDSSYKGGLGYSEDAVTRNDLARRKQELEAYAHNNKDRLGENYDGIMQYLKDYGKYSSDYNDYLNNRRDYYSQFADEDEFSYSQMTLDELEAEKARLEKLKKDSSKSFLSGIRLDNNGALINANQSARDDKKQIEHRLELIEKQRFNAAYKEKYEKLSDEEKAWLDEYVDSKEYIDYSNRGSILSNAQGAADLNKTTNELVWENQQNSQRASEYEEPYRREMNEAAQKLIDKGFSRDEVQHLAYLRQTMRDYERQQEILESAKGFSEDHPVLGFAGSRAAYLVGGVAGTVETIHQLSQNDFGYGLQTSGVGYTPTKASSTIDQKIMADHDFNVTKNIDLFDFGYQIASSTADNLLRAGITGGNPTAIGAIMGTQVFAQSVIDGKEKGYSDKKAIVMAVFQAAIEAATEKWSMEKVLSPENAKSLLGHVAKSFAAEGTEEIASNWLNRALDQIANGDYSELSAKYKKYLADGMSESEATAKCLYDIIGEDLEAGLIGGVSGGLMGGGAYAARYGKAGINKGINNYVSSKDVRQAAKGAIKNDIEAAQLVARANEAYVSDSIIDKAVKAQQAYAENNSKENRRAAEKATKALAKAAFKGNENINATAFKQGVLSDLQGKHENAEELAKAIVKMSDSTKVLSPYESTLLSNISREDIQSAYNAGAAEVQKHQQRLSQMNEKIAEQEYGKRVAEAEKNKLVGADREATITVDGEEKPLKNYKITSVSNKYDTDGNRVFTIEADGKEYSSDDKGVELKSDGMIIEAVADTGASADSIRSVVNMARTSGLSPQMFALAAKERIFEGMQNIKSPGVSSRFLNSEQSKRLYEIGRELTKDKKAKSDRKTIQRKSNGKVNTRDYLSKETYSKMWNTKNGKAKLEMTNALAKFLGRDITLVETFKDADGNYYYKDSEGRKHKFNANGMFDIENGKITLDVNSDRGIMNTLSHELVHLIRSESESAYREMADWLVEKYGEKGKSLNALVYQKMSEDGSLNYDEAFEEVVAESWSLALESEKTIDNLAALAKENKNLFDRIKEGFESVFMGFREYLKIHQPIIKSVEAYNAQALKELDGYSELFVKALAKVAQGEEAAVISANEENTEIREEKYQIKRTINMSWAEQINEYFKKNRGKLHRNDTLVLLNNTPNFLQNDGVLDLPFALPMTVITKAQDGRNVSHTVNDDNIKNLQSGIKKAVAFVVDKKRNSIFVITNLLQKGKPVVVSFIQNKNFDGDDVHQSTSIHIRQDLSAYLSGLSGVNIYVNNKNELIKLSEKADILSRIQENNKLIEVSLPQTDTKSQEKSKRQSKAVNNSFDSLYLELAKEPVKNRDRLQKMVIAAAEKAGYINNSDYQGTSAFNGSAPADEGWYANEAERLEAAENGEYEGDWTLDLELGKGIDMAALEDRITDGAYRRGDKAQKESILALQKVRDGAKSITMYRSVPSSVKENGFRNGDWITPSEEYARENARIHGWGDDYRIIKQTVPSNTVWWDGNDINEFGYDDGKEYAYKNTPNNIKSLEAVTYDDNGNIIPLSQRFNESKSDSRFQSKLSDRAVENLKAENKYLKQLIKIQGQVTHGTLFTRASTQAAAKMIINKFGAKGLNSTDIGERISKAYTNIMKMQQPSWDAVMDELKGVAEDVQAAIPLQRSEYASDILKYIRKYRLSLTETQKQEAAYIFGSYDNFRKRMLGNAIISNSGTPLDVFWKEAAELYPSTFSEDTNEGDMVSELFDTVNSLKNSYEDEYAEEIIREIQQELYDKFWSAATLYTAADKYSAEINRLKAEHREKIKAIKEEQVLKLKTQNAALKYVEDQKKKMADKSRRMERTEYRKKIVKLIDGFNSMLTNPQKKKYVPSKLVRGVVDVLEAIDIDTGRGSKALRTKLDALSRTYESYKDDPDFNQYHDEVIQVMLKELDELLPESGRIYDENITLEQTRGVYQVLKSLKKMITSADEIKTGRQAIDRKAFGKSLIKETKSVSKAKINPIYKWMFAQLSAERMFHTYGNWQKDSSWDKLYRILNDGQLKQTQLRMEATKLFEKLLDNENIAKMYEMQSTAKDKLVDIGLKDADGNPVKITRAMMLSIAMHLRNEDNAKHVILGGLTVPDLKRYYKGEADVWGPGSVRASFVDTKIYEVLERRAELRKNEAENEAELEEINKTVDKLVMEGLETLANISATINKELTDYEADWLDAASEFFDGWSKDTINKATMEMYDFKKATVNDYFPIHTDPNFRQANFESIKRDFTLENAGWLKTRVHASNPILLEDITDVINYQIEQVSRFCGIAPAIREFSKAYGYTGTSFEDSVQDALASKFGAQGKKYIEDLLADLQGARSQSNSIDKAVDKLRGTLAQATLTLNLRVALAQAASYPTASAVVGHKALLKALKRGGQNGKMFSKADKALIEKYSPLLWYRLQGNMDIDISNIKNQKILDKVNRKLFFLTNWIQQMDGMTVGRLWYAAEYYVEDELGISRENEEQFYTKVAEVFNDIVEKTQPNYTTMQRPAVLRTKSSLTKMLTMFMTQRLQNFNILYDATNQYIADRQALSEGKIDKTELKQSQSKLVSAVSSQIVATVTITVMKTLVDALMHNFKRYRDDEDDELKAESAIAEISNTFLSSIVSNVVGGSELYNIISSLLTGDTYYGVSLQGFSSFENVVEYSVKFAKDLSDGKTSSLSKDATKLGKAVCQFFGIPINNASKIATGIINWGKDIHNYAETGVFDTDSDVDATISRANKLLFGGNIEKGKRVLADYKEQKVEQKVKDGSSKDEAEKSVKTSMKSSATSYYKPLYLEAHKKNDAATMNRVKTAMGITGLYDDVDATVNKWVKDSQK